MNVQQIVKPPAIHFVVELKERTLVTSCGKWLSKEKSDETTAGVTCKKCLKYQEGGFTSQEKQHR